jgi:hypothetical protein
VASLLIGLIFALVVAGTLYYNSALLRLRVSFAQDQISIFEDCKRHALSTEVSGAVRWLDYIVNYYPSGTKQVVGSPLDNIVEASRSDAIEAIISQLRTKTGENLGDNPEPWIQKYRGKTDF